MDGHNKTAITAYWVINMIDWWGLGFTNLMKHMQKFNMALVCDRNQQYR